MLVRHKDDIAKRARERNGHFANDDGESDFELESDFEEAVSNNATARTYFLFFTKKNHSESIF